MAIEFECKACGAIVSVDDDKAGESVPCPECGTFYTAPTLSAADAFEEPTVADADRKRGTSNPTTATRHADRDPSSLPKPVARRHQSQTSRETADDVIDDDRPRIPCRECGELIIATAKVCRFCNARVRTPRKREKTRMHKRARTQYERRFHRETIIVGVLWILNSLVSFGSGGKFQELAETHPILDTDQMRSVIGSLNLFGLLFIACGILTLMKKAWSLWVGLVGAYLMCLLAFSVAGKPNGDWAGGFLLVLIPSIVFAHRALLCLKHVDR